MDALIAGDGSKRKLAGFLQALAELLMQVPGGELLLPFVQWAAALLGTAGIVHASFAGTALAKGFKLPTISSLLGILAAVASTIPQLYPYAETLRVIAGIFGAAAVTKKATPAEIEETTSEVR